jgi:hypothetical protein
MQKVFLKDTLLTSAVLYSIIETAKACSIKPDDYLMHVMQKIMDSRPIQKSCFLGILNLARCSYTDGHTVSIDEYLI